MSEQQEQERELTEDEKNALEKKAMEVLEKTGKAIFSPSGETKKWLLAAVLHLLTSDALGQDAAICLRINGKAIRIELDEDDDGSDWEVTP